MCLPAIPIVAAGAYGLSAASAAAINTAITTAAVTAVTSAAGAAVTAYGQNQSQKAQNAVAQQANDQNAAFSELERQRQQSLQDQKQGVLSDSLAAIGADKNQADQATLAAQLAKTYSAPATAAENSAIPGLSGNPATEAGPRVVLDTYKKDLGNVGTYLRGQAKAKGKIDAFAGTNLATTLGLQNNSNQLGLLNNFSSGSRGILPIEQGAVNRGAQYDFQNAANKGNTAQTLGSALTTAGNIYGYAQAGKTAGTLVNGGYSTAEAARKAAPFASGFSQLGNGSFVPQASIS